MAESSSEKPSNWTSSWLISRREDMCARFESALRDWQQGRGEQPKSESFLAEEIPVSHRWEILHCLLLLEEDYRRQMGEGDMVIHEFPGRFPDFSSQIALAFPSHGLPTVTQVQASTNHGARRRVREYELQEKLGQGGMGIVWKAWHVRLKRYRALKVLHSHLLESSEVRDRFINEMEALARFEHHNIVRAHDAFEEDGELYLVMEYVDGCDMSNLVGKHGNLTVGAACEIAHQAAQGLAALHDQHVTHRDIKPSNLMLTKDPKSNRLVVKVMDLGLSQLDNERGLTNSGDVFGTCEFMAPEQYDDCRDLTPAADIYALGCSLFYLLAGTPPFTAEGNRGAQAVKLMLAHRRDPVPRLREICPEGDQLQPLLNRMMAKKAEQRFDSAVDLLGELEPFASQDELVAAVEGSAHTPPGPLPRAPRPRGPAIKWTIAACLVIALIGVVTIALLNFYSAIRLDRLHSQAVIVASQYGAEVERRLAMLDTAAADETMHTLLLATKGAATDSEEIKALCSWLAETEGKSKLSDEFKRETDWFITDADGRQVARAPRLGTSLGKDYWTRSYYHGGPNQLDPEVADKTKIRPIREATISAPYISSTSGRWKVALSVPIFTRDSDEPIGIICMSAHLDRFMRFESQVAGSAVVLVDLLREDWLTDQLTGGQVIAHPLMGRQDKDVPPNSLTPELVDHLQRFRKARLKSRRLGEPRSLCEECISRDHLDPVAPRPKKPRRAAYEPVFLQRPGSGLENSGWMVVVEDLDVSDRRSQ